MAAGPYELIGAGGLTTELKLHYNKLLFARAKPLLVHMQFGRKDGIPRNEGRAVSWRRFDRPAANTTALTEGTPGAVTRLSVLEVQATISQYGTHSHYTDLVSLQTIDPYISNVTEVFAEQMAISLDTVVRDVMLAGTTIQYASAATTRGGASGVGSGMVLNYAEVREAVATLRSNDAPPFPEFGNKYAGIIHPNTEYDLMADSDVIQSFQQAGVRGEDNPIFKGAIGDFYGVRWFVTSRAGTQDSLGLSNVDVYTTLILGKGYYGMVDYDAMRAEVIVKPIGSAGSEDPLNQVGSIGWKAAIAAARLDNAFAVRIEHSVTLDQGLK